jgi:hypothetical protein
MRPFFLVVQPVVQKNNAAPNATPARQRCNSVDWHGVNSFKNICIENKSSQLSDPQLKRENTPHLKLQPKPKTREPTTCA